MADEDVTWEDSTSGICVIGFIVGLQILLLLQASRSWSFFTFGHLRKLLFFYVLFLFWMTFENFVKQKIIEIFFIGGKKPCIVFTEIDNC